MTVNTTSDRITLQANGSTKTWNFPFPAVDAGFLQVYITDSAGATIQLPTNDYTVTLNPPIDPNPTSIGGFVTFPLVGAALSVGNSMTIVRTLPGVQPVSLSNQSIIYPPVIEEEFDYLTLLDQQGTGEFTRAFRVGPADPIPAIVPPVGVRKNQNAFFDDAGNLVPGQISTGVFISAVMQPVVGAATLALARQLMGVDTTPIIFSNAVVITDTLARQLVILNGNNFYTVTFGDPASYSDAFWVILYNFDNRGKTISIPGITNFILYPQQSIFVWRADSTHWIKSPVPRWRPGASVNFFVDPANGNDLNDGLATGTNGAFLTIAAAVSAVQKNLDGDAVINLQNGTHNVGGGVVVDAQVGTIGGITITGNVPSPSSVLLIGSANANLITAQDNAVLNVSGVTLSVPSNGCGLLSRRGAVLNAGNFITGGSTGGAATDMIVDRSGIMNINGPYHIASGTSHNIHIYIVNAFMTYAPGTCTIDGPCDFPTGFFVAQFGGEFSTAGAAPSFPGGTTFVTGKQYDISYNSNGTLTGAVPPGTVPGTTANSGFFV